jgi:large subunit ribosomal protein L14e
VPVDRITLGQIVKSTAGRDCGRLYMVVGFAPPSCVLVADGRGREAARPKKKNVRHISVLKMVAEGVAAKVADGGRVSDREVRAALKTCAGDNSSDADEEGCACPSKMS